MKKLHAIGFYQFGSKLGRVRDLKPDKQGIEAYNFISEAITWLEFVCNNGLARFSVSIPNARLLLEQARTFQQEAKSHGFEITQISIDAWNLALTNYETVFAAEVPTLPAYLVSQERNYLMEGMVDSAEKVFSEKVRGLISEQCKTDIRGAGKCIAYELGTACGFHSYRALEGVARSYAENVGFDKDAKKRDLGTYLDWIATHGADQDTVQVCDQLRKLRRNPLIHPEDNLDIEAGIEAFQLATAAIACLVLDMETKGFIKSAST